jgi:hypothetical protein
VATITTLLTILVLDTNDRRFDSSHGHSHMSKKLKKKTKLCGLSPSAHYTDWETAAWRWS